MNDSQTSSRISLVPRYDAATDSLLIEFYHCVASLIDRPNISKVAADMRALCETRRTSRYGLNMTGVEHFSTALISELMTLNSWRAQNQGRSAGILAEDPNDRIGLVGLDSNLLEAFNTLRVKNMFSFYGTPRDFREGNYDRP